MQNKHNQGGALVWVIVIILVIVGVWFFASSDETAENDETATTTEETSQEEATGDEMSQEQLQSALTAGASIRCTFEDESVTATSYLSEGEMRTIAEADALVNNVLFSDGQVYIWEEGSTDGVQFSADVAAENADQTAAPLQPDDITQQAATENVSCAEADVDVELFELPEDIEFMSMADTSAGAAGQTQ